MAVKDRVIRVAREHKTEALIIFLLGIAVERILHVTEFILG